jgi:hypothetical protein
MVNEKAERFCFLNIPVLLFGLEVSVYHIRPADYDLTLAQLHLFNRAVVNQCLAHRGVMVLVDGKLGLQEDHGRQ